MLGQITIMGVVFAPIAEAYLTHRKGFIMPLPAEGFIAWSDRYSVGISFMDEQHYRLVELANELYESLFADADEKLETFKECMSAAVSYVKVHFSAEEELMRAVGYPQFADHKGAHEEFVRRVLQAGLRFEKGDPQVGRQFVFFLRDWLLEHIAVVDKRLASYAKSKGHG
jgi:hemerythrin-like metal-binding protein